MSMDRALKSLVTFRPEKFLADVVDTAMEIREKGFQAPHTRGLRPILLKTADVLTHASATAVHASGVVMGMPETRYAVDAGVTALGYAKFLVGKIAEKQVGKGGFASDLKNSGRFSIAVALSSFGMGIVEGLLPIGGQQTHSALSAATHLGATMTAFRHAVTAGSRE